MLTFWIGVGVGGAGVILLLTIYALCAVAKRADEHIERSAVPTERAVVVPYIASGDGMEN